MAPDPQPKTQNPQPTTRWHLAQYNIAWMIAPYDDERFDNFRARLDEINQLGDRSPGFVWRHQEADGNSTSTRIRNDDRILINFTVWESVEDLFEYAFHSDHVQVYRQRNEWFEHREEPWAVLWWVPAGHEPTVEEGEERLRHLADHGPTPHAFTFKQRFPAPHEARPAVGAQPAPVHSRVDDDLQRTSG